jgi:hypothetical protein
MNKELETFNAILASSLLSLGEWLGMRACKVEQTIALNVAEILED